MVLKYDNIFYSKALQILPELVFWFENKPSGNPGGSVLQTTRVVMKKMKEDFKEIKRLVLRT
jgi:hypothetical protein